MNGQKRNRVLVCPVSAGREILQEAPIRTLQILIDAIQAAQTRSFVAGKNGKYPAEDPATEVVLQIDETDYIECETPNVLRPDSPESGDERKGGATPDIPGAVDTFHQKETRENNKQTDEIPDVLIEYPPAPGSNATTKKSRREREFEMRKERMAERRTKTERLRQQEQRTRLKKAKQETVERVDQQRELVVMRREDDRSRAVERYTRWYGFKTWLLTTLLIEFNRYWFFNSFEKGLKSTPSKLLGRVSKNNHNFACCALTHKYSLSGVFRLCEI